MRAMALAVALLVPTAARAQTADVNALVHEGVELRRAHRDAAALRVFQRAWEVSHAPRVLAQIGFAELALGHWVDAEAHLTEAMGSASDPWVTEHRALLQEALGDVGHHVGSLDVTANVAGAEVRVEGQRVGALPLPRPVRVVAGTTTLEVLAPGFLPVRRGLVVTPGALTRETVTLLPVDAAVNVAPAPDWNTREVVPVPVAPPPAGPAPGGTQRVLAWTTAGVAVLGVGVGVAALVLRNNAVAQWNDPSCLANGRTRLENCAPDRDSALTAGAASIGGFVAGAALAVTSVVLFVTAPSARDARTARFGCGPGPGDVGITCGGTL